MCDQYLNAWALADVMNVEIEWMLGLFPGVDTMKQKKERVK